MEVPCKGSLLTYQGLPPMDSVSLDKGGKALVHQYVDKQEDPLGDVWGALLLQCGHALP